MNASPLEDVVKKHDDINVYGFADDHGLRKSFRPMDNQEQEALGALSECLGEIKTWMDRCRLQMNCSKTEFIKFGSRQQLAKCISHCISVCDNEVQCASVIRYLGAWLDSNLNFKHHIRTKCKTAMLNFLRIKSIADVLDRKTLVTLIIMLVISHLDYANCLLTGIPKCEIKKFERIQIMLAKLVLGKNKRDSANECLKELHWLPIRFRIDFKNMCLVYKCLNGLAPKYLEDLLVVEQGNGKYSLRSGSNTQGIKLKIPRTKRKTFADRSFSVAGPKEWNSLPNYVKKSQTLEKFKQNLKTYYFKYAFNC